MSRRSSYRHATILALCLVAAAITLPNLAKGEEQQTYVFDRMWPTLKQPWYFRSIVAFDVDSTGHVYVIDGEDWCVRKYTSSGTFLGRWGRTGEGPGEYKSPIDISADTFGNVYVADKGNNRIQKMSAGGTFLGDWSQPDSLNPERSQFSPARVAADAKNNVYVVSYGGSRVQKFAGSGQLLSEWVGNNPDPLENFVGDISVDKADNAFVSKRNVIYKFNEAGSLVDGVELIDPDTSQRIYPSSIAVNTAGNFYVSNYFTQSIFVFSNTGTLLNRIGYYSEPIAVDVSGNLYTFHQLYSEGPSGIWIVGPSGLVVGQWQSHGTGRGQFGYAGSIGVDSAGNLYVADRMNNKIEKFSANGVFLAEWGSEGEGPGEFSSPAGVAADAFGNVYVSDSYNYRIQKFTSAGTFIQEWHFSGGVEFSSPAGIAVSPSGNIFVADLTGSAIVKYTATGQRLGLFYGAFLFPSGIAADSDENLYITDPFHHEVYKYSPSGTLLDTWRGYSIEDDEGFMSPEGIAVDSNFNVFVADAGNNRIQKYSSTGHYLGTLGSLGTHTGQFKYPIAVAVDSASHLFVLERDNNRIQRFKSVQIVSKGKAIVVAGGGQYVGNYLWDSIQFSSNFAHRALEYQGFTKEAIYYLSSDTDLDLDNNGLPDDVNSDVRNTNLEHGILQWASGADSLVIYLVDHGGDQTFRMNGTETLSASDLDAWLDQVDPTIAGPIIVIYEACQSGSFLDVLAGPNRIIITSAQADESAYFLSTGTISFSSFFWTYVFNGATVQEAFNAAVSAVGQSIVLQHPQMSDPNNLASTTYIGNGTKLEGDAPVIVDVSDPQVISSTATAELVADPVTDIDGVSRVWAVIQPPDYVPPSLDNPVQNLPSIELFPSEQDSPHWSGTYDGFTSGGTYTIAIYATDRQLNTSSPKITSVSVNSPLARKAIILAGGVETDPLWPAIQNATLVAYNALKGQGYSDDTIRFYSPITFNAGVDGLNALSNLQSALTEWAVDSTQDVVLYLCGNACGDVFAVNATESVSANQLDAWLDQVQAAIPGKVAVVIDASNAGQFVSPLIPPNGKSRIVITGAGVDEAASFASVGDVSFSNYFWRHVLNGATVEQAFRLSATAIRFSAKGQTAQLDDNGNGIANEKSDGILSRFYRIGSGIQLAADDPLIGSVSPDAYLASDATSSLIFAENVTTTGVIDRVWAEITPPGAGAKGQCNLNLATLDLAATTTAHFEAEFDAITQDGTYTVALFAKDAMGNISIPSITYIKRGALAFADIDNNDANDAVDLQLVINAALNLPIDFDADVDRNMTTDAVDVQLVINAALGS
jgi:sugar lactone lactonase YvrE